MRKYRIKTIEEFEDAGQVCSVGYPRVNAGWDGAMSKLYGASVPIKLNNEIDRDYKNRHKSKWYVESMGGFIISPDMVIECGPVEEAIVENFNLY